MGSHRGKRFDRSRCGRRAGVGAPEAGSGKPSPSGFGTCADRISRGGNGSTFQIRVTRAARAARCDVRLALTPVVVRDGTEPASGTRRRGRQVRPRQASSPNATPRRTWRDRSGRGRGGGPVLIPIRARDGTNLELRRPQGSFLHARRLLPEPVKAPQAMDTGIWRSAEAPPGRWRHRGASARRPPATSTRHRRPTAASPASPRARGPRRPIGRTPPAHRAPARSRGPAPCPSHRGRPARRRRGRGS